MTGFRAGFCVAMLLVLTNVQAQIYKYVDKDGNVTYSQVKPLDNDNVETIKTRKAPPVPAPAKPAEAAPKSTEAPPEDEKQPADEVEGDKVTEAENADIKRQNCEASKSRLSELNNAGRIKITGEDGNIKWASEEDIQARKDQLQANVDKWCN